MSNWRVAPESAARVRVKGRPTGYSAGENEKRWKQAVSDATVGVRPPKGRIGIEIEFVMLPTQVGHLAPDLDNLIKSTVDALIDCIGERAVKGRKQADDERVDIIVARKHVGSSVDEAGASLAIWSLESV